MAYHLAGWCLFKRNGSPAINQQRSNICYGLLRDGPLKTYGGGGGVRKTKKNSRKGKLNEKKILARQLILQNIHAMA